MTAHSRPQGWALPQLLQRRLPALLLASLVAGCGGGGGGESASSGEASEACTVDAQKRFLQSHFNEWYLWTDAAPKPAVAAYSSVADYFEASLYTGGLPGVPADRWSGYQDIESFTRFFDAGQSLGYGLFVAALEVEGRPDLPLHLRYVEPLSPAQAAGLKRGDELLSINGVAASQLIASSDYSLLSPSAEGRTIELEVRRGSGLIQTIVLTAAIYTLTPVSQHQVLPLADGSRLGYLLVKDMLTQGDAAMTAAFSAFAAAGVRELVLDLRYNGGGLISVGAQLASHVAAGRTAGQTYAWLRLNSAKSASNSRVPFSQPTAALNLSRVYVLTGRRTCSASEQVINALSPFVDVVRVGDTTCGKPVGWQSRNNCGITYSVVNFDSVNAYGQGDYYDGFVPTCAASDDTQQALGDAAENLLAAAINHVLSGQCVAAAQGHKQAQAVRSVANSRLREPGEFQGMVDR